jgi:hypothetical protein
MQNAGNKERSSPPLAVQEGVLPLAEMTLLEYAICRALMSKVFRDNEEDIEARNQSKPLFDQHFQRKVPLPVHIGERYAESEKNLNSSCPPQSCQGVSPAAQGFQTALSILLTPIFLG